MKEEHYEIVSVKPVKAPPDMGGDDWHCYVIAQGTNTIRGYRPGNFKTVTQAVEEIVAQLNERRIGKRARANLAKPTATKPAEK